MTNAERITTLRNCSDGVCSLCPYDDHELSTKGCEAKLMRDAADALEAADKKIEELEEQHGNQLTRNIMLTARLPKEGEWFKYNNPNYSPFDDSGEYLYHCNKCGRVVVKETNYCPNCGAKMRGEPDV